MANGIMVISLDFELMWGMLDIENIKSYGENVIGGKQNIPFLLQLFSKYNIHATWGCVGLLYYENCATMRAELPQLRPGYTNKKLSSYMYIDDINDENYKYFSGKKEIELIKKVKGQEIASHTFSHYYCMEAGQNGEEFLEDIEKSCNVAKDNGDYVKSIIFPRNQFNKKYSEILKKAGIVAYRGNEQNRCYAPQVKRSDFILRIMRLLDTYFNICGNQCYSLDEINENGLLNIRSSRFLRPYSPILKLLEPMRMKRIKKQMKYAAEKGKIFHIWWHPHNFGKNTEKNNRFLIEILDYYLYLEKKYGMLSLNMQEVGEKYYEDIGFVRGK